MTDPTDRLAEIKAAIPKEAFIGTHFVGCETSHPWCAVVRLVEMVERLMAEREQWVNSKEYMDWWCATKEVNESVLPDKLRHWKRGAR